MYKKMKTPPLQGHPRTLIQKWFVGMTHQDRGCKHRVLFCCEDAFELWLDRGLSLPHTPCMDMGTWITAWHLLGPLLLAIIVDVLGIRSPLLPSCGVRGGSNCDMETPYKQRVLT